MHTIPYQEDLIQPRYGKARSWDPPARALSGIHPEFVQRISSRNGRKDSVLTPNEMIDTTLSDSTRSISSQGTRDVCTIFRELVKHELSILEAGTKAGLLNKHFETLARVAPSQRNHYASSRPLFSTDIDGLSHIFYESFDDARLSREMQSSPHDAGSTAETLPRAPAIDNRTKTSRQLAPSILTSTLVSANGLLSAPWWIRLLSTALTFISDLPKSYGRTILSGIGPHVSPLHIAMFVRGAAAHGYDTAINPDWKQRATESLTDFVAQCALLVPSFILLGLGGFLAFIVWEADYALAGLTIFMAIMYGTIQENPKNESTGLGQSVRTSIGILYLVFMSEYCRRVILSHKKDKGTSAAATLLGLAIGFGCLASTSIRDFTNSLDHSPVCVIPLALPLGFLICDVFLHLVEPHPKRRHKDSDYSGRHERLETQRCDGLYDTSSDSLRFHFGLSRGTRYNIDAEEYNLGGYGGNSLSQMPTMSSSTQSSSNFLGRLFSRPRAS